MRSAKLVIAPLVALSCVMHTGGVPAHDGYIITGDSTRLYYRIEGSGGDTIVAIHGGPGVDLESIRGDFAPLAEHFTVIYYDQRGAGRSDLPIDHGRLGAHQQVEDLEAVRRFFRLDRMALVAHSYGPLLAASYAIAHPDRVARMVFFAPIPPRRGDFWTRFGRELGSRLDSSSTQRMNAAMRTLRESTDGDDIRQACREYWALALRPRLADPSRASEIVRSDLCGSDPRGIKYGLTVTNGAVMSSYGDWDLREAARRVSAPTLIVHGERDAIPMDLVAEWTSALPHSRLLRITDAAHFPYAEQPRLWPEVVEFLKAGAAPS